MLDRAFLCPYHNVTLYCSPKIISAPVLCAGVAPSVMLRFKVAMLRVMLRLVLRKLLILKQCYMLRFFLNVCGGQIGKTLQQVQFVLHYILGRLHIYIVKIS